MANRNPKSELQEIFQKLGSALPDYQTLKQGGQAHCPLFKAQVTVHLHGQELVEHAEGRSKKAAEKDAAQAMLARVKDALGSGPPSSRRLSPVPSSLAPQPVLTPQTDIKVGTSTLLTDHETLVHTPGDKIESSSKTSTSEPSGAMALDISGVVVDSGPSIKGRLQELLQKRGWPVPAYSQVSRTGPSHKPVFSVKCVVKKPNGEVVAEAHGNGCTRKEADKNAAVNMHSKVEKIFQEGLSSAVLPCTTDLFPRSSTSPPEIVDSDLDDTLQLSLSSYTPSFQTKEGLQENTRSWLCLATVTSNCSFPVTAQGMGDTETVAKRDAACNLLSNLSALGYTCGQEFIATPAWLQGQPDIAYS